MFLFGLLCVRMNVDRVIDFLIFLFLFNNVFNELDRFFCFRDDIRNGIWLVHDGRAGFEEEVVVVQRGCRQEWVCVNEVHVVDEVKVEVVWGLRRGREEVEVNVALGGLLLSQGPGCFEVFTLEVVQKDWADCKMIHCKINRINGIEIRWLNLIRTLLWNWKFDEI